MSATTETFLQKAQRKFTKEPLVPLGTLVTAGVLTAGVRAFSKGNSQLSQKMMRWRVIAQGCTVAAIVFGAGLGLKPHDRPKTYEEKLAREKAILGSSGIESESKRGTY